MPDRHGSLRDIALLARELAKFGHSVKLMPPGYVKPYVKRGKNDATDAEAICEAASRPNMRFVPVKNADQQAVEKVFGGGYLIHRSRIFSPANSWPANSWPRNIVWTYPPTRSKLRYDQIRK